jgi:hypothetical protein
MRPRDRLGAYEALRCALSRLLRTQNPNDITAPFWIFMPLSQVATAGSAPLRCRVARLGWRPAPSGHHPSRPAGPCSKRFTGDASSSARARCGQAAEEVTARPHREMRPPSKRFELRRGYVSPEGQARGNRDFLQQAHPEVAGKPRALVGGSVRSGGGLVCSGGGLVRSGGGLVRSGGGSAALRRGRRVGPPLTGARSNGTVEAPRPPET